MRRPLLTVAADRPPGASNPPHGIEPALTIDDVCAARNASRRTGERERSAGHWPRPDFYVGTGPRKSPRWLPATIRRWLTEGGGRGPGL